MTTEYKPKQRTIAKLSLNTDNGTFQYVHTGKARLNDGVSGTFVQEAMNATIVVTLKPLACGEHADFPLEKCKVMKVEIGGEIEDKRGKLVPCCNLLDAGEWGEGGVRATGTKHTLRKHPL